MTQNLTSPVTPVDKTTLRDLDKTLTILNELATPEIQDSLRDKKKFNEMFKRIEEDLNKDYEYEKKIMDEEIEQKLNEVKQLEQYMNEALEKAKESLKLSKTEGIESLNKQKKQFCTDYIRQTLRNNQLELKLVINSEENEKYRIRTLKEYETEKKNKMEAQANLRNQLLNQFRKSCASEGFCLPLEKNQEHYIADTFQATFDDGCSQEEASQAPPERNDEIIAAHVQHGAVGNESEVFRHYLSKQKAAAGKKCNLEKCKPFEMTLLETNHLIGIADHDDNQYLEISQDYEKAIEIYEYKIQCQILGQKDKERDIRKMKAELKHMDKVVLESVDSMKPKKKIILQLEDLLDEVKTEFKIHSQQKKSLESEFNGILLDLNSLFELKDSHVDHMSHQWMAILNKYKSQLVIPSLNQLNAAQNRLFDEQDDQLRREIMTMKEQLRVLRQEKQADKDYLVERSVAIIEDNENLRKAIDETCHRLNRFMSRAGLKDPITADQKLVLFLESETSIRDKYEQRIAQLEKENEMLLEQIRQVRAMWAGIRREKRK